MHDVLKTRLIDIYKRYGFDCPAFKGHKPPALAGEFDFSVLTYARLGRCGLAFLNASIRPALTHQL